MNRPRTVRVMAVVALAAIVALAAAPAFAHSALTGVDPAEGSTVTEGSVVTLSFNEELLDIGTEIVVTDAAGVATPLTPARPVPSQVAVTLPALAEGAVSLAWRVVSADGHPIEGTLAYVAPAPPEPSPSPSPSPTPTPSPSEAAATVSASPSPLIAPAPGDDAGDGSDGEQGGLPPALWIAIAAAIAAAGAVAVATKRRS